MKSASYFLGVLSFFLIAAKPAQHLSVKQPSPLSIKKKSSAEMVVELHVADGFHVQSNPAATPLQIATKLQLDGAPGLEIGYPVYPKGRPYRVEGLKMTITAYEGTFSVRVPIKALAAADPGTKELKGKIRYQACNDQICFQPTYTSFTASVRIEP